ncbi:hypothetical protein ATI45_4324 [Marinobacter sp. LV10MA510-1]|nr:hypothetical protein ATI45_4324 [Marinobacter sp. LV10MA510-1]
MNTIVRLPESPEITYHFQAGPCHSLVVSVQSGKNRLNDDLSTGDFTPLVHAHAGRTQKH